MSVIGAPVRLARSHIQMYASDAVAPIQWRLLGGNNRELGRGAGEFPDQASCLSGIEHLRNVVSDLDVGLRRNEAGAWGWQLSLGGVPVAMSGFRYDRQIRCRQGEAQFVSALATCEIGSSLVFTHTRRWGVSHRSGRIVRHDLP